MPFNVTKIILYDVKKVTFRFRKIVIKHNQFANRRIAFQKNGEKRPGFNNMLDGCLENIESKNMKGYKVSKQ